MPKILLSDIRKDHSAVLTHPVYGKEYALISSILNAYPLNDKIEEVAKKVAVIDVTNTTNISRYKSVLSLYDVAEVIVLLNIDARLAIGDPEVVNDIARECKKRFNMNLFSFASKYCCYHNTLVYGRDDYSIFDSVVSSHLHKYSNSTCRIPKCRPETWRANIQYELFNQYIGELLDSYGISSVVEPQRRRMLDHSIWITNK